MRDFPNFTTQWGTAGLILKQIPYRREAYIHVGTCLPEFFREHLNECVSFCTMAGAERIYASGNEELEAYPLECAILEMRGQARVDRENIQSLFPVTEATAGAWREHYNRLMAPVPLAAALEAREEKQIAEASGTYFVHENGKLLGIGWMEDTRLLAIAAEEKGAGRKVMNTLLSMVEGADVTLEVASTNERAIRLYESMGFIKTREVKRWYKVL